MKSTLEVEGGLAGALDQKKALSVIFYIKQALDGLLPLPHNTNYVGIGVISIGNGSTKQMEQLALPNGKNLQR